MKKIFVMAVAAILTFCGWMSVSAQTKQGEWYSSSWLGAGMSTFAGDIEDDDW